MFQKGCDILIAVFAWLIVTPTVGAFFASNRYDNTIIPDGVNGGVRCLACTLGMSLVGQYTEMHNQSVANTLDLLCNNLPYQFRLPCKVVIDSLGPPAILLLEHKFGPDVICHALKICYTESKQPTCRTLTPPLTRVKFKGVSFEVQVKKAKELIEPLRWKGHKLADLCKLPGLKAICKRIKNVICNHLPLIDDDGDMFSTYTSLRGTSWRGRDCADQSKALHPGARPVNQDRDSDSNCNGIFGVNNITNKSFEEELCEGTRPMGIVLLGDSIGAHFHIPPQWIDPTQFSAESFINLPFILENELDWPMLSAMTGFMDNKWPATIAGPVDSIYLRLLKRNRCNHRDYQNIAHNGADSFTMVDAVKTLSRDQKTDLPVTVVYALVGNDICNTFQDTLAHMTTPKQFYENTMAILETLRQRLPKGSHVIVIGLVDGRILYETMGQRNHPCASYWGGFTYSEFYDFLGCLQISPCTGWMTSNSTLRDLSSKRAAELTEVLKNIVEKHQDDYDNFDLYYMVNPLDQVLEKWKSVGGEVWQLIEPVDGFHANQVAQGVLADVAWGEIERQWPHILGEINPNNDKIRKLFGDQGGY